MRRRFGSSRLSGCGLDHARNEWRLRRHTGAEEFPSAFATLEGEFAMPIRLQELHPALVHFPVTLIPVAIGADVIGRIGESPSLLEVGRRAMPLSAFGATLAAAAGCIAQEEVRVEGVAHNMLVTHRNLNLGALIASAVMAVWRSREKRPSAAYIGFGLMTVGTVTYTAYLGGRMVYEHGVGVRPAGLRDDVPEITLRPTAAAAREAAAALPRGMRHAAQHIADGSIAPTLGLRAHAHDEPRSGTEQANQL